MRTKRPHSQRPINTGTKFPLDELNVAFYLFISKSFFLLLKKSCLKYGKTRCNFYKNPVSIVMVMLTSLTCWGANYSQNVIWQSTCSNGHTTCKFFNNFMIQTQ